MKPTATPNMTRTLETTTKCSVSLRYCTEEVGEEPDAAFTFVVPVYFERLVDVFGASAKIVLAA